MNDTSDLNSLRPYERERIEALRGSRDQTVREAPPGRREEVDIRYSLNIPSCKPDEFRFPDLGARQQWPMEIAGEERLPEF